MLLGLTYQLIRFIADLILVRTRSDAQLRAEVPLVPLRGGPPTVTASGDVRMTGLFNWGWEKRGMIPRLADPGGLR